MNPRRSSGSGKGALPSDTCRSLLRKQGVIKGPRQPRRRQGRQEGLGLILCGTVKWRRLPAHATDEYVHLVGGSISARHFSLYVRNVVSCA